MFSYTTAQGAAGAFKSFPAMNSNGDSQQTKYGLPVLPEPDEVPPYHLRSAVVRSTFLIALLLIGIFATGSKTIVQAAPIRYVFNWPDTSFQPHVDVFQEQDESSRLRYSRIQQSTMHLVTHVRGKCGSSYRISAASIMSGAPRIEDYEWLLQPLPPDHLTVYRQEFDVNSGKRTFGWHIANMPDVPTNVLDFERIGEELLIAMAQQRGVSPAELRQHDFQATVELKMTAMIKCRFPPGQINEEKYWKGNTAPFRVHIKYHGSTSAALEGGGLVQPTEPETPGVDNGGLTTGVRIEQNNLMALPDDRPDSCRLHLSASLKTSGPTEITYRFRDGKGAVSPVMSTQVDTTGIAFISHPVDLVDPDDETLDLTAETSRGNSGGIAIDGGLQDQPTDRLRGFYRLETISPHSSVSNPAGFNFDTCEAEEVPRAASVIDAFIVTPRSREKKLKTYD